MTAVTSAASLRVHVPWIATQPPPVANALRTTFHVSWERALRLFAAEVAAGSPTSEELSQRVSSLYFQGGRSGELCRWTRLFRAESIPLNTTQVAALAHCGEWPEVVRQLHDAAASWHPLLAEEALLWAVSQHRWSDADKVSRTFPVLESKCVLSSLPNRTQNFLVDATADTLNSANCLSPPAPPPAESSDAVQSSLAGVCEPARRHHDRHRDAAVTRFLLHRCAATATPSTTTWAMAVSHCLEYAKVTSPTASLRLTATAAQLLSTHTHSQEFGRLVQAAVPAGTPLCGVRSPLLRSMLRSGVRSRDAGTCAAVLDALSRNGSNRLSDVPLSLLSSAVRTCVARDGSGNHSPLGAALASRISDALRDRLDSSCRAALGGVILQKEEEEEEEEHRRDASADVFAAQPPQDLPGSTSDGAGGRESITSLDAAATRCVRSGDWEGALALAQRIRDPRAVPLGDAEVAIQNTLRAWRCDWQMSLQFFQ